MSSLVEKKEAKNAHSFQHALEIPHSRTYALRIRTTPSCGRSAARAERVAPDARRHSERLMKFKIEEIENISKENENTFKLKKKNGEKVHLKKKRTVKMTLEK